MRDENQGEHLLEQLERVKRERDDLQEQVYAAADRYAELQTDRDTLENQNLVEQTWLRMELNKATEARDFWIDEATKWATIFAAQRQNVERYQAQMDVWVDNMKALARGASVIDVIICCLAFLVIAGVVPPVFLWR